ncbi:YusW family protein [Planococcus shenhongbingii]|uniref:YusW family protein n=1 Tax=Planococcus shenhongbingii TaxID=3058398 RepID=UPI002603E138|nr:YusW family protein [Planococcus sp. N016]WKA57966.1 YusW family protein [Planococcus sp. N016]
MTYNKTSILTALLLSSALVLSACGESDEVNEPVGNESQTDPAPGTGDASPGGGLDEESIGGGTFGFTEFSVDVDYPDQDDAIDISYEEDRDNIEASFENKLENQDLSGNDAMDEIEPAFQQLDLSPDTPNDEAIEQVIGAFGIEAGYNAIEIDVRFSDGTEKEFKGTGN